MLYAHSHPELPEAEWQTLEEHQSGVAELAGIAAVFGTPNTAELLGNIHDTGKRSDSFQARLRGKGGKVDHTSAAYLYLKKEWGCGGQNKNGESFAQLMAYPLLGHHGGMTSRPTRARGLKAPPWAACPAGERPACHVSISTARAFGVML